MDSHHFDESDPSKERRFRVAPTLLSGHMPLGRTSRLVSCIFILSMPALFSFLETGLLGFKAKQNLGVITSTSPHRAGRACLHAPSATSENPKRGWLGRDRSLVGSQVRGGSPHLDDVSAALAAMTNHWPNASGARLARTVFGSHEQPFRTQSDMRPHAAAEDAESPLHRWMTPSLIAYPHAPTFRPLRHLLDDLSRRLAAL